MRLRRYSVSRHLTTSVGVQIAADVGRRGESRSCAGPVSAARARMVQKMQASASRNGCPRRCGPPQGTGGLRCVVDTGRTAECWTIDGWGAGRRSRNGRGDCSLCIMRLSAFGGSRRSSRLRRTQDQPIPRNGRIFRFDSKMITALAGDLQPKIGKDSYGLEAPRPWRSK
jgi:hypothetical protein